MALFLPEPARLPVTLDEVKAFLRVGFDDEDALITGLARAAADMCEAFTGRALIARAVEETLAAASAWTRLEAAPVREIGAVAALDAEGAAEPLAVGDYAIDVDAAGEGWVRVLKAGPSPAFAGGGSGSGRARRVRVSYSAGMAADMDGLPEALRHGIVRLAAHLHTHRDPGSGSGAGQDGAGPPAAVTALWRPWRRLRLR